MCVCVCACVYLGVWTREKGGVAAVTRDGGSARGGGRGVRVAERRQGREQTDQGHTVLYCVCEMVSVWDLCLVL